MNVPDFRQIEGHPGYFVSRDGQIGSIRTGLFRILRQNHDKDGYPYVGLSLGKRNKIKTLKVHRLVAGAFIQKIDGVNHVNHKDGVKTNNHVSNLEWVTDLQNKRHSAEVLGNHRGIKNPKAKLSAEDVHAIRKLFGKYTVRAIAKKYKMHTSTIHRIKSGTYWGHT